MATAKANGSRLIANDIVKAYIDERMEELECEANQEEIEIEIEIGIGRCFESVYQSSFLYD
ncbi:hypothetical protein [Bacillus sp. RS11]|uniref:hypothetical protein n=1 Tax=Lysinibacillus sp. RS11 TaxID=3242682 RepID=UPI0035C757ED